jgi:hypothetical protein
MDTSDEDDTTLRESPSVQGEKCQRERKALTIRNTNMTEAASVSQIALALAWHITVPTGRVTAVRADGLVACWPLPACMETNVRL